MLKRNLYKNLLNWKETHSHSCLMINGARQVGKTYLIREFGRNEYESFIEINFIKYPELKKIFNDDLSSEAIIKNITSSIKGVKIIPNKTLLFLDEIQACGNARTSLKFLAEESKIDVITSGSLLGLTYGFDDDPTTEIPSSIPVGYEEHLTLFPLDFEEFLWALGYKEDAIKVLYKYFLNGEKVPDILNDKYESLFSEYIVVGGMPEVVDEFVKTNDFTKVSAKQDKIIKDYNFDIAKHAKGAEKIKVRKCYDSVPFQLAKELKKFQYSFVEKGQTSKKYGNSIQWLKDSNLVNPSYLVHDPELPLNANANFDQFKLYMNDTGLLMQIYGFETKKALLENTIVGNAKGGIFENVVAQELVKKGYKLYYFKPGDEQEIEFLIEKDGSVIPLEVKAGNSATVSLNTYIKKYNPKFTYKLIRGNLGINNKKVTIPHYMILFL